MVFLAGSSIRVVECVGVFLNEMNASFFTIASLSLKMAEIATSGWSTLADIENSYFKGGYKKSYWGTLFDHRQMLFKNSINKTERLYPFKIKNIKILPFCIIAMDVMSFFFSIFPLVWFCCVSFLSECAKKIFTISWGKLLLVSCGDSRKSCWRIRKYWVGVYVYIHSKVYRWSRDREYMIYCVLIGQKNNGWATISDNT